MKFRAITVLAMLVAAILSACSLADDITPPPGYKTPTPAPTLGPLFPPNPPDLAAGAAIYVEKCAPCHGATGLGDGQMTAQLPVAPPALGKPAVARVAAPVAWYTIVTQGKLQSMMPPFASLSEQQRWDVVAYSYSLSITDTEVEAGKALYETNCAQCHGADGKKVADADLTDQSTMVKLSQKDLVDFIQQGVPPQMPPTNLQDEEAYAVAAYMRTFTFPLAPAVAAVGPTSTPLAATATPETLLTEEGTPAASPEPGSTTAAATPAGTATTLSQGATFTGTVTNASGGKVPADLPITLLGFEHDQAKSTFNKVFSADGSAKDGAFSFADIELVDGRIYVVEVKYSGVPYQSDPISAVAGQSEFNFAPFAIYETTDDFGALTVEQVHFFFDAPTNGQIPVSVVYVFTNQADKSVMVAGDGTTIPFITVPEGVANVSYQDAGMGAQFLPADSGFAIPPSTQQYGIVASFSMPFNKELSYSQSFKLTVPSGSVIVPEGMKVKGEGITAGQVSPMGQGQNFQTYSFISANNGVTFLISGAPKAGTSAVVGSDTTRNFIIGLGAFGVVLILTGVFLFLRDRRLGRVEDEYSGDEEDEDEGNFEAPDEIMDAIIALDEQYKAGNLAEEAYQQRRSQLKELLKRRL